MVPENVLLKMAEPVFHHRTPEYELLFAEVNDKLKKLFLTEGDVFTLASSGTGAMETAVVNVLAKGDKAVTVRGGKFGERWDDICKAYGIDTIPIDVEWGYAVTPDQVKAAIESDSAVKAVFTTQSETSTGALTDLEAIGKVTRAAGVALVTDAVSGLGAHELRPDDWGVDMVVSGSQKTMMLPPGLGFISVSRDSWKWIERSDLPKYYWDIKKYKKSIEKNQNPFTPPVTLIKALNASLDIILGEGLENIWKRTEKTAEAMRAGVRAIGLDIFPKDYSNVLTAVLLPSTVDGGALVKALKKRGIFPAGGQEKLKGRIIRVAHIGYLDEFDVLSALSALEMALKEVGYSFAMGTSLAAAQEKLAE